MNQNDEHKQSKKEIPELINISRKAGRAIVDFKMLQNGDKVCVAVSGGKDSLSLMHVLRHRQKICPIKFELVAVHVDFEFSDFDPDILIDYLRKEGFQHHVETVDDLKGEEYKDIDCYRWSKHRRKALFGWADKNGFTKLAFGHHLDDISETIVLNQFYRGEIGAMKPKQELFDGAITIIRPLAYVREEEMANLAQKLNIHNMGQSKCAYDDDSHRIKIKHMLRDFEKHNPAIVKNIFRSLSNIKEEYLLDAENIRF